MAKRKEIMLAMYEAGMTYEQIGKAYGISRQAVHQAINSGDRFHLSAILKIPYVGLRLWMLENRVSCRELNKRTGVVLSASRGINPRMDTINKILNVTGLTYEECFNTEDTKKKKEGE